MMKTLEFVDLFAGLGGFTSRCILDSEKILLYLCSEKSLSIILKELRYEPTK